MSEFTASANAVAPWGITTGLDGNLWFTESTGHNIGRITPAGVVTEFPTGPTIAGRDIISGPDGALWFINPQGGGNGAIGRMTTAGVYTGFPCTYGAVSGITSGADGNLWFTAQNNGGFSSVVRMTTAGVQTAYADMNPGSGGFSPGAYGIAAGSDGNLWFTHGSLVGSQGQIASINPTTHVITEHPITAGMTALAIVADPTDGQLWFTNQTANGVSLNRITTAGVLTTSSVSIAGIPPLAIGPDGNVWSIDQNTGNLYDFTESFATTTYSGTNDRNPGYSYNYAGLTTGPDGNMWFTESQFTRIGRLNVAGLLSHARRRMSFPARH